MSGRRTSELRLPLPSRSRASASRGISCISPGRRGSLWRIRPDRPRSEAGSAAAGSAAGTGKPGEGHQRGRKKN